jgi:ribA/ribD-fused uncharacterized protein
MGGPCWLVQEGGAKVRGPPCTDNFQCLPFDYNGKTWLSAEQCYQAAKFLDEAQQEAIRAIRKTEAMSDHEHGMDVWNAGQRLKPRPDWDAVKVQAMFDINLAKYKSNPELQAELLATQDAQIVGAGSTGWNHPTMGYQNWSKWNGLIQMRVRELLKPAEARDVGLLRRIEDMFELYAAGY